MELWQNEKEQKKSIDQTIGMEWRMFDQVNNIGGRASCQNDFSTFYTMRYSQLLTWEKDVLKSYEHDLEDAEKKQKNLIELKYAYMMRDTEPDYFQKYLAPFLPAISEKKQGLVEKIMEKSRVWYQEAKEKYPHFVKQGRPETGTEQSGMTSVDVYLKGELYSYSEETLEHYLSMVKHKTSSGCNMICEIYENTAKCYGFENLAAAEKALKSE